MLWKKSNWALFLVKGGFIMLERILETENIMDSINENSDYLFTLIPELNDMVGFNHKHPHHHLDVWEHTLYALSLSPVDFEIRLVLLLHDIGKPHCYIEGEVRNFHGHANKSMEMARIILNRFNYDNTFIEEVCYLIEFHDLPISLKEIGENKDLAYKRYIVQYCDSYAHHPDKLEKRVKYLNRVKKYLEI